MIKKILQLMVVLLITAQGVIAQEEVKILQVMHAPGEVLVEMQMNNFTTNVAYCTYYIEFDSDVMDFVRIEDTQLTGDWLANYVSSIDKLIITYTATPTGTGYIPSGKILDLVFDYHGGFSTAVSFDAANCEVGASDLSTYSPSYENGSVTQTTAVGSVSMTSLTEPIGNTVNMPVAIAGTGFGTVDAITLEIAYDETQLTYAGIANSTLTGVVASAGSGVLTINWTGTAQDFTSSVNIFDVQFVYYGGSANVEFIPGCEIAASGAALATDYVDGTVTAAAATATLTIDAAGAIPGNAANVPIVASGFTGIQAGAVTLQISFDNTLLTYTGYTAQQLTGWAVNANSNGEISLICANSLGIPIADGDLVTLNFNYVATGGLANIVFDPGSILTSTNLVTIPTTFVDGSVSGNTVSGMLTYNGDAAKEIYPATVYLKNSTTDAVMYTTTTDAAGDYEFEGIANGTYYLDGTTTIDASQSYVIGDAYTVYAYSQTGSGLSTPLQLLAADVNEDGAITVGDAYIIYGSIQNGYVKNPATWKAPEWIFENTAIVVNSNVVQNFGAISSGNASANFIPVP